MRRIVVTGLVAALGALGCARPAPGPLRITSSPAGRDTRLTLVAAPHLKISARLPPALELADGRLLRLSAAGLTADSSYFAEPPSVVVPGRQRRIRGTLRASVCRDDEQVCRSLTVEL